MKLAAAIALLVALLLTVGTHRRRQMQRNLADQVHAVDRYVDAHVRLHVVAAGNDELLPGKPPLRILRSHSFGGWIDTKASPPRLMPECELGAGRDWYCSEDQESVILHGATRPGALALGGMGAGKTTAGVMWTYLRWLEHVGQGREGGITAPTNARIEVVLEEVGKLFVGWHRHFKAAGVVEMCDGTLLRTLSTHRQSESQGSRIQGFNWSWWLGDELQDQTDEFIHISARLRSGVGGKAKRLATATAKDESDWRALKDSLESSGDWTTYAMAGTRSPFVFAEHWAALKRVTTPNDYRRLVLAEDMPSELAVYYGWDRTRNLVALPRIATDVTAGVLADYQSYVRRGARFTLVCSHDPGSIYNTTEILRLVMFGDVPTWMVVGELQTKQTTQRQHAKLLREKLQDEYALEYFATPHNPSPSAKAVIFCDPHGKGEAQTDYQSVYMAFQSHGLDVFSPAPMTGKIKRAARIEMVNRLLGGSADAPGVPRLVVTQANGRPVAPKLVEAFEELKKRPGDDNPEGTHRKDEDDKTHAPAALAYGLWAFEQEAFTGNTVRVATAEAKRRR